MYPAPPPSLPTPRPAHNSPPPGLPELIADAKDKKLITDRTEGLYQDQITRLQFAELAVNLIEEATGKEITPSTPVLHRHQRSHGTEGCGRWRHLRQGRGYLRPQR